MIPTALVDSQKGRAFVLRIVGDDDADKQRQSDHAPEEYEYVDVDGVDRAQRFDQHVSNVQPAFEGQDFEQCQHGIPDAVKVEPTRIGPVK